MVRRLVLAVLVVGALALLTISFRSPSSGALHDVQSAGAAGLRPFQVAAERVARPFRDVYGYFSGLAGAKAENEKLKKECATGAPRRRRTSPPRAAPATCSGCSTSSRGRRIRRTSAPSTRGDLVSERTVRAADRDRRGLELRHPPEHTRRQRRRSDRARDESEHVDRRRDAAHRSGSQVSARDLATGVSGMIRNGGRTCSCSTSGEGAEGQQGRRDRHEGTRDRRYPSLYPYGIPIGRVDQVGTSDIASYRTVQVQPFRAARLARLRRGARLDEGTFPSAREPSSTASRPRRSCSSRRSSGLDLHAGTHPRGVPDLLLVTLVAVALLRGALLGAVGGFFAGLLVDTATLASSA